ncbi:MAG: PilN domain-containing protein [Thermodesulfobacteriota bacterium]
MIRINLLPVRAFKRKESIRKQITIFVVVLAGALVLMGLAYFQQFSVVSTLKEQKANLEQEEKKLQEQLKSLAQFQKEKEALQEKLRIITELEEARRGPVRILDELSRIIPKDKAWLTKLDQKGTALALNGMAIDNDTVSQFLKVLKASSSVTNVELIQSQQKVINEIKVQEFSITCGLTSTVVEKKEESAAGAEK